MSKLTTKKNAIRVDEATKEVIKVLSRISDEQPGLCLPKAEVIRRSAVRLEERFRNDVPIEYDIEAIAFPDEKFMARHWSKIREHSARRYKKFIAWEKGKGKGVRLGSLEDYQENQHDLKVIAFGVADCVEDRTKIIRKNGGVSFTINIDVKLLSDGKNKDTDS